MGPRPALHYLTVPQTGRGSSSMVFLLTIALYAGVAYVVIRCEPKEDRPGEREKRWWPRLKF